MKIPYFPPDIYVQDLFKIPSTDGESIGVRYSISKKCLERLVDGVWQDFACAGDNNGGGGDPEVPTNDTIYSKYEYIGNFPYGPGDTIYGEYTYFGGLRLTSSPAKIDGYDYIGSKDIYIDLLELI